MKNKYTIKSSTVKPTKFDEILMSLREILKDNNEWGCISNGCNFNVDSSKFTSIEATKIKRLFTKYKRKDSIEPEAIRQAGASC